MGVLLTITPALLDALIDHAIAEDLGISGDITSQAIFPPDALARALIKSKAPGILSGAVVLAPLFARIHPAVTVDTLLEDGAPLEPGQPICRLSGPVVGILSGERIALNFLQHLSGIATATNHLVGIIGDTGARLLDTRKTVPTLRALEKKAVVDGGGHNHRFGLYDMVMIKDTHVDAAGGVTAALTRVKKYLGERRDIRIEIEVRTLQELREAVDLRPDRIMLDNMDLDEMAAAVAYVRSSRPGIELEASGNINARTIAAVARTGVDFISCGWITHSAPALDVHLIIEKQEATPRLPSSIQQGLQ